MEYVAAVVLTAAAVCLFAAAPALADDAQQQAGVAFGEGAFSGPGWNRWFVSVARFLAIVCLVGAGLTLAAAP